MPDFLGTPGASNTKTFRPFEDARRFARHLGLRKRSDWVRFIRARLPERGRRPPDVPGQPHVVYRHDGWSGWEDWLGVPARAPRVL